jgi:hypothetical protein
MGEVASKGFRLLPVSGLGAVCRQRRCRKARAAGRLAQHSIPIHDASDIDEQVYLMLPFIDRVDVHGLPRPQGFAKKSPPRILQVVRHRLPVRTARAPLPPTGRSETASRECFRTVMRSD